MSHVDGLNADEFGQVSASVRRLFERLNASVGNPNVYDFEVSQDTGLPVDTVRRCLQGTVALRDRLGRSPQDLRSRAPAIPR